MYMTTAMATSVQPRPQPQATGTAATRAANGTAMKMPSAMDSPRWLMLGSVWDSLARRSWTGLSSAMPPGGGLGGKGGLRWGHE